MRAKIIAAAAMLGLGLGVGSTFGGMGNTITKAAGTFPHHSAPVFPKNSRGQTYGPIGHVTSPKQYPNLVLVQATNGRDGYVYSHSLQRPAPKNPQQAVSTNPTRPRIIPVYAQNGTTVIGQFVIGGK